MNLPDNWEILRDETISRYRHRCYRCDKKKEILTAHHIIPREEGGGDELSNLIALCCECHDVVEILGIRSKAAIIGSYDEPVIDKERQEELEESFNKETFTRPDWHRTVYGGDR